MRNSVFGFLLILSVTTMPLAAAETYDVVIYGGTPGGITAAIQTARLGKRAILIEPSGHLGGMTAGGLGATDIGNKQAIGGMAREFYRRVFRHYQNPQVWIRETVEQYRTKQKHFVDPDTLWSFEPHVAEHIFEQMLSEQKVTVLKRERLVLEEKRGVVVQGGRIKSLRLESGKVIEGRMFVDATYEGDLFALAGVSFRVGREANAEFGETLNGSQIPQAKHHQFVKPVDPFLIPGKRDSGLLPGIESHSPEPTGTGDHRVQAYCFRLCTTDDPQNRVPWSKPANYSEKQYELLLRNFEAGDLRVPWSPHAVPNRKTDCNNNYAVSTDWIGANYDFANGDYATRERITRAHEEYQKGLLWTLANHPRVPEKVRQVFQTWGMPADEFVDNGHWPHQLYIREARRMVGKLVMTEHHCRGTQLADHSVGLAAYTMDSHHVRRYVDQRGAVRNEGDVEVGGFPPYPIGLGAIVPRDGECENLLVPVCLSATHIAYGSIRMEPVFMILGQSAATMAVQALEETCPVQQVSYPKLREQLLRDGQILEWKLGTSRRP